MCPILNGYGDIVIELKKLQVIRISILNVKNKGKKYCQTCDVSTHHQLTISFFLNSTFNLNALCNSLVNIACCLSGSVVYAGCSMPWARA
jgi:hypothetical protein